MSSPRLTETSYIVLGLLEKAQPATPYDLKQLAQVSTVNFWALPHTQLYTECARLTEQGLL
jgi:PadR family transcriptional regulator AphA